MNSKSHLIFSLIKSLLRILACVIPIVCFNVPDWAVVVLGLFGVAEVLGIVEELGDKR